MEGAGWIWEALGIAPTEDVVEIRRAYARRLKAIDTEADPAAFIDLRAARDSALALARGHGEAVDPPFHWPRPARPDSPAPLGAAEPDAPEPPPEPAAPPPDLPPPDSAQPPPQPAPPPPEPSPPPPDLEAMEPAVPEQPPLPPDPGPMPAMIVAESALPELDPADLDHVESLLAAEDPPSWAELETATRRVLESPAAERIELARWLEGWAAERIAHYTPRSDPMIEPAVEHFGWESDADLNRPPIIDWIMQRRTDRAFELELSAIPGPYSRLIGELRRPMASPPGRLAAWWKGVRVEYLLAYLHTLNPTVLAGLNPETVAWWEAHIAAQPETRKAVHSVREWRRKEIWAAGITGQRRPIPLLILVGIVLMPYIFAWFLLQKGYGAGARILAFGWLAALVLIVLTAPPPPPDPTYGGKSIEPHYLDMETDVAPVVAWATEDRMSLARIAGAEPALFKSLSEYWSRAAGERESGPQFREAIVELLRKAYCEGPASDEASLVCASILARKAAEQSAAAAPGKAGQPLVGPVRAYKGPPAPVDYLSFEKDVGPILGWTTGGEVSLFRLREGNRILYSVLVDRWNRAQAAGTPGDQFQDEIAALLRDDSRSVLRGGRFTLQSDYWRLVADEAAYARTLSDEACEAWLRGDSNVVTRFPPDIEVRGKALAARALLDPEYRYLRVFGAARARESLTVPPSVASRAARIAGMDEHTLGTALTGGGTAAQRCDARIGLIEAALTEPKEVAAPVFEQLAGY